MIFSLTIHPFVLSYLHFQSAFAYVSHKLRHLDYIKKIFILQIEREKSLEHY